MSTYSTGNPPTDATNWDNIVNILNLLPDNTNKLISPKDVRDGMYTNWENIIFKLVSKDNFTYIGTDTGTNGLTKSKIYFGKRQFSGLDIMSSTLLNRTTNDSDIFLYNTKPDSGQQNTKISILSGTNSTLYNNAPYIESKYVTGASFSYLDLNLENKSTSDNVHGGNVNINSDYGYVSLNGMFLPKYINPGGTYSSSINGRFLRYNSDGYLTWEEPTVSSVENIISSGTVSIVGSPVIINGYDVNFTDATPVPVAVGGVAVGTTFSNVPVTEVLRAILYPYLTPLASITLNASPSTSNNTTAVVVEYGNITSFSYNYTITKRSNSITTITGTNLPSPSAITPPLNTSASGSQSISLGSADINTIGLKTFALTVGDGTSTNSGSATLRKVLPYFYGTSATTATTQSQFQNILNTLQKNIKNVSNTITTLSGQNVCIYFAYPSSYNDIRIYDGNGFELTSSFVKFNYTLNSPSGYWNNQSYKVYIYTAGGASVNITTIGTAPNYIAEYTFTHI